MIWTKAGIRCAHVCIYGHYLRRCRIVYIVGGSGWRYAVLCMGMVNGAQILLLQGEHVPGLEPPQEAVGYSPGEQGVQLKVQEYDTLSQESVSRPSPVAKAI